MKQQKTVESRVLEILKECPMSRYDDMLLILHYYNRYGYIPAGNLPLEDIVFNYRAYGLSHLGGGSDEAVKNKGNNEKKEPAMQEQR